MPCGDIGDTLEPMIAAHQLSQVRETPAAEDSVLGDFLRAHRARLTPEQVGLASYGARRVPGLRREEVAQLAGISPNYYVRLEQGHATGASPSVIAALARALMLDEDATAYLHSIADVSERPHGAGNPGASEDSMAFTFDEIVHHVTGAAAISMTQTNDVLSCNKLAHELFFAHLPVTDDSPRWNTHRLLFTDPFTRGLFKDWQAEAELAVASLRFHSASHPGAPAVRDLVGELSVASCEFASLWAQHPVARCTRGAKRLSHPGFGDLELEYQVLDAPDGDGRRLLIYAAAPGYAGALGVNGGLMGCPGPASGRTPDRNAVVQSRPRLIVAKED